jgi:hypothetical protein
LGDTIQFIRYAALVKQRGGTVVCECQPKLVSLLAGVAGVDELRGVGSPLPPFDVQAPLLSLPGILGTTMTSIPADVPYLRADAARVEHWRQVLAPVSGFKIGIAWRGSKAYQWDRYRSVSLALFDTLARLKGVRLINLQKGPGTEEIPAFQEWMGDKITGDAPALLDFGDRLDAAGDFLDTAAVLMNLDLVVTVDSVLTHLAGAIGVPVWLALSTMPEWRWFLERSDSPWYPSVRIFRQRRLGQWVDLFERIAAAVRGLAGPERPEHTSPGR